MAGSNLAYCPECKIGVAAGKFQVRPAPKHTVNGNTHVAKIVAISDTDAVMTDAETRKPEKFLERLVKKYVK